MSEVDLLAFWRSQLTPRSLTLLTALVKADLQARFARGQRPSAADYLALFPDLRDDRQRVVSLIYEEFCLLEERHEGPEVDQFCALYEAWSDSLRSQLAYHRDLSQVVGLPRARVRYPEEGEIFESFELRKILGTGGAAQVYLASDRSLAGRSVVLKLSDSLGVEPDILAQLDHKNIVPIYRVVNVPGSELRGICMPYYRGQDLDTVLKAVAAVDRPRRAATILDLVGVERRDGLDDDDPWTEFPAAGTYSEGIAWLGVRIANALHYLHLKGIHHRDIKPANILVTPRNGLRLLDFNLAHSPNTVEFAQAANKGGTLPYMAPEQLRAFLDPKAWGEVGAAADIYACGLLLRELVTGRRPHVPDPDLPVSRAISALLDHRQAPPTSCRDVQPDVPPSLDAIILKCLAYHPVERYATAEALCQDLRRFLKRLPPIIARSSSSVETTVNWAYRRRKVLAALGVVLVACGLVLLALGRRDIRQSSDFRQGMTLLESADRADWKKALEVFRALSEQHQETAWPPLYQRITAEKLADRGEANGALATAVGRGDAVEVFREHLATSRSDSAIWQALGRAYREKMDWQNAEVCLTKAEILNPNQPAILVDLGGLRMREQRYLDSIEYLERAIAILSVDRESPWLHMVRRELINSLSGEINRSLAERASQPGTPGERAPWPDVAKLLKKLDTQITLLDQAWQPSIVKQPHGSQSCILALCRASLASARGYDEGSSRRGGGEADFRRAAGHLADAEGMAAEAIKSRDAQTSEGGMDFARQVVELRNELNRRWDACKKDPISF